MSYDAKRTEALIKNLETRIKARNDQLAALTGATREQLLTALKTSNVQLFALDNATIIQWLDDIQSVQTLYAQLAIPLDDAQDKLGVKLATFADLNDRLQQNVERVNDLVWSVEKVLGGDSLNSTQSDTLKMLKSDLHGLLEMLNQSQAGEQATVIGEQVKLEKIWKHAEKEQNPQALDGFEAGLRRIESLKNVHPLAGLVYEQWHNRYSAIKRVQTAIDTAQTIKPLPENPVGDMAFLNALDGLWGAAQSAPPEAMKIVYSKWRQAFEYLSKHAETALKTDDLFRAHLNAFNPATPATSIPATPSLAMFRAGGGAKSSGNNPLPLMVAGAAVVLAVIAILIGILRPSGGGDANTVIPTTDIASLSSETPTDGTGMTLFEANTTTATANAIDPLTTSLSETDITATAGAIQATVTASDVDPLTTSLSEADITATAGAIQATVTASDVDPLATPLSDVDINATAGALAQVAEITEIILPTETPTEAPTEIPTEAPTETPLPTATLEPLTVVISPSALIAQTGANIAIDASITGEFSANSSPIYEWYVNDTFISTATTATYEFSQATAGDYIVKVVIREMSVDGVTALRENNASITITVVSVDFMVEVPNPNKPLEVVFTPVLTGGSSAFYGWDINVDTIIESNDEIFTYTFPTEGAYSVELTVNINNTDFKVNKDVVASPPPLSLAPITENASWRVSAVVDDPTTFTVLACVDINNCLPIPVLDLVINGAITPIIEDFQQGFPSSSDAKFTLENNKLMLMPGTLPGQITVQSDAYGIGVYTFNIVEPAVVANVGVESASTVTPYTNGVVCETDCDVSAIRYEVVPATPTTVELVFVAKNNDMPVANAPVTVQFATIIAPPADPPVSQGALNIGGTDYAIPDPTFDVGNNVYNVNHSAFTNELGEVRVTLTLNSAYSEAFLTFSSDLVPEPKWVRIQPLNGSTTTVNAITNTIISTDGAGFRVAGTTTTMINREVEQVLYIRNNSTGSSTWNGATYLWLRAEDISGTGFNTLNPDNTTKLITSVAYCTVITCVPETATLTTFFPTTTPIDTQFVELGRVKIAGADYVFVQVVGDFNN